MRPTLSAAVIPLSLILAVGGGEPASACRAYVPFHVEDIGTADVVFTGKLIRYELVSGGRPNTLDEYALLTVRVGKVLKGKASGDIRLYWSNSTFGVPRSMKRPETLLIAAIGANGNGPPVRGPSATIVASKRPDLLQILQAPCSAPFILPYSQKSADNIHSLLRGDAVGPYDYFAVERPAGLLGIEN